MFMLRRSSCIILQICPEKHTHTNSKTVVENDNVRNCSIETGDETSSIVSSHWSKSQLMSWSFDMELS